jgi:hypothetical protein
MTNREKTEIKIIGSLLVIFLVTVVALILNGCNPPVNENPVQQGNVLDSNSTYTSQDFKIYTLDGCEYIVVAPGNSHFTWGSHKGDCKNHIHQCCDDHYTSAIDTTEKHFDCTVESIEEGDTKNKYMYTTECGLVFYSNQKYKVGQTLKNFESPKHK